MQIQKKARRVDQTLKRTQATKKFRPICEDSTITNDAPPRTKRKDFLMQSNLITERIRFEILLDSIEEVEIRSKAIVIIGKIANVDPTRKVVAYNEDNE